MQYAKRYRSRECGTRCEYVTGRANAIREYAMGRAIVIREYSLGRANAICEYAMGRANAICDEYATRYEQLQKWLSRPPLLIARSVFAYVSIPRRSEGPDKDDL